MKEKNCSFLSAVPQFSVSDIVRTTEYYRDVLGFQIVGYWNGEQVTAAPDKHTVFAIVRRDQVEVFFNATRGDSVRSGRAEGAYDVYFRVTGIDALAQEFSRRGANILEEPSKRSYGQRELIVEDCNRLILAFAELL